MPFIRALIVHGGASDIPDEARRARVDGCRQAADAGWSVLARGGSALEAVGAAVHVMEDDPVFDAGRGSYLNTAGEIELDAIIMDGRDLSFGAVAAVQRVRHPITLARLVMTESEHAMLVGAGAETFAREHGLPLCPTWELVVEREAGRWRSTQTEPFDRLRAGSFPIEKEAKRMATGGCMSSGTVGAVALDADGNLAAATSTGGTSNKYPGRVGDSPLIGCGAYADNCTGAVSATGKGEALMKVVISKAACDFIAQGMSAQEAANAAISLLAERTTGQGGLIVLDRLGRVGIAHDTPHIAYAHVAAGGDVSAGIEYRPDAGSV